MAELGVDSYQADSENGWPSSLFDLLKHNKMLGIIDQGIVGLTSFATVVLLGRAVRAEELGIYSLALSVILFARMVQESAITAPYPVFTHHLSGQAARDYNGNTIVQALLLVSVGTILLVLFTLAANDDSSSFIMAFYALCVVFPFILFREFMRQLAFAHLQLSKVLSMDGVIAVIQIAGLVILINSALLSPATAYLVMGIACVAGIGLWLGQLEPHFGFSRAGFVSDLQKNWGFGKWALGGQATGTIMFYAMPWLLTAFHSTASAGLLAACSSIVGLINTLLLGLGYVLTPHAAKAYAEGGHQALWRTLLKFLLVFLISTGGFALFLILFGGTLIDLLFDGRYPDAGPVIKILALNLFVSSLVMVAGNGLWALNRPSANFLAEVVRLIATLGLVLFLVPAHNALGAAYALLGGSLAGGTVSFIILWRNILAHDA